MTEPPPSTGPKGDRSGTGGALWRRAVLVLLGFGLVVGLVPNGAQVDPYHQVMVLVLALPLMLALGVGIVAPATRRALVWVLACAGLAGGWALIQTLPLPAGWPAHPIWDELAAMGTEAGRYLSVAPQTTRDAIPALILPMAVFAAMLILCQRREDALWAWTMLMLIGWGLLILSVVLELFFAQVQFFAPFPVGRGTFAGIFVNRNATAAFLGLVALVTGARLMLARPARGDQARPNGIILGPDRLSAGQLFLAVVLFAVVVAVIATRSRAGVGLALAMLTLAVVVTVVLGTGRSEGEGPRSFTVRQKAAMAVGIALAVLVIYGEQVLARFQAAGLAEDADFRWCAWVATWAAFADRPLTGSGFGTFAAVFPQFRDAECLGTQETWSRAHNSYVEFLAGMGLPGAAVLAIGFWGLIRILWTGATTRRSLRAIPVFTAGALGLAGLHSFVDFPLQLPGIAAYFAAILGVGCAVSLLERRSGRGRSGSSRRRTRSI